jgi:hypothetical protein
MNNKGNDLSLFLRSDNCPRWLKNFSANSRAPEQPPIAKGTYVGYWIDTAFDRSWQGKPRYSLIFSLEDSEYQGRTVPRPVWLTDAARQYAERDLLEVGIENIAQLEDSTPTGSVVRYELEVDEFEKDNGDVVNQVSAFRRLPTDAVVPDTTRVRKSATHGDGAITRRTAI